MYSVLYLARQNQKTKPEDAFRFRVEAVFAESRCLEACAVLGVYAVQGLGHVLLIGFGQGLSGFRGFWAFGI